jgi:DNA-binding beta-propeller fold protein YncE
VAGNDTYGYSGDGGPAAYAQLKSPAGIAVDSSGNLYIADTGNFCIREIAAGNIFTVAGSCGNLSKGYPGDGGPATDTSLQRPTGVALDSAGNLLIADYLDARIRKVSHGIITTVAGCGRSCGNSSDYDQPALSAVLHYPGRVAADAEGNVFFTDPGDLSGEYPDLNRVYRVFNGLLTVVAGDISHAGANPGDGGLATNAAIFYATGISVGSGGVVFFADSDNQRIRVLNPAGTQFQSAARPLPSDE